MKSYQSARIYKIYDIEHPEHFYIGSTSHEYLSKRLAQHRSDSKKPRCQCMKLYQYLSNNKAGWDIMNIELVEDIQRVIRRDELHKIEGAYIKNLQPDLNKFIPGRGMKEYQLQYNNDHKEDIQNKRKQYYEAHKEQVKQYNEDHKEAIKERVNQVCVCDACNCKYIKYNKAHHFKTAKHLKASKDKQI
jgi:hypothetical protein